MLARRALGKVVTFFKVEGFRVSVERRHNALGQEVTLSEAVVKVIVDGERIMNVGEGNGPVNALDMALRKDLGRYSKWLEDLKLVDYKVRILTGGTEAVTRVMIESADGKGRRWSTVGVSANTTASDLANVISKIDPFVPETCWIVSAAGYGELFKIAAGQIGTMVFGGTTPVPTVWGTPVFKVKGLPANVYGLYGDFKFTSAVAVKSAGLQITAARELLIRNNQTLFAGIQRVGISNHAPEYCAALVKATA